MHEHDDPGWRPDGPDDDQTAASAARWRSVSRRDAGVRRTRQVTGWTAAALVAGVAAGAGYFAHAAAPAVPASGTAVQGTVGSAGQKPSLTHPVVTSGGSGVTAGTTGGAAGPAAGPPGSRSATVQADN